MLSDPKFIACQIIPAFTFAGPSFHFIATSSSSQPHIVFISNFNFISFSPRPYCLTLQPSYRSFRFVTILQPTIFNGSCSYFGTALSLCGKMHRLGHAWLSMYIFWDPVALWNGKNTHWQEFESRFLTVIQPISSHGSSSYLVQLLSWSMKLVYHGISMLIFFYIIRWYLEIVAISGTIKVD